MIIATAPSRISLFGSGTDLSPFCEEYGGKVLNMAINLRHNVKLYPSRHYKTVIIHAMDDEFKFTPPYKRGKDAKWDLIGEIINSYGDKIWDGLTFEDHFEGIQSAGLGSSASAAVSMIGAFNKWLGIKQSKAEIAEKAYQMETNLGWVSGRQDQYASAFGGVNFFEFDGENVWNDPIKKGTTESFLSWCLLVYTGKTRHSAKIQDKLRKRMEQGQATEALKKIRSIAWGGREALRRAEFDKVGYLINKTWELKKESNPDCTNKRINEIYDQALNWGAIGGKICGAGSDGHMLFIVPPRNREKVLKGIGLDEIDFSIDYNGLETRQDK